MAAGTMRRLNTLRVKLMKSPPDASEIYFPEGAVHVIATRPGLGRILADILVVVGGKDFQPTLRMATELAELIPKVTVVVQRDAGHYPWLDDAPAFVAMIAGLFEG
jgi:pimeloyl-ACP methyl ester carboxylesterase